MGNKHITILKVDIEGEEMWCIPQILQTELLRHINQIHIEVHVNEKKLMWGDGVTCSLGVCNNEYHSFHYHLSKFMHAIQKSVSQYGFRLIYYTPNDLLER